MKILDKIIVSDTQPYNKNVIWCDTSGSIPYLKYYIKGSWKSVFIQKMYEATVYVYSNNTDYGTVTGGKTVKVKEGETASVELKATPASGYVLYKWQQSSDGETYTDIQGATSNTYNVTISESGVYYFKGIFRANQQFNIRAGYFTDRRMEDMPEPIPYCSIDGSIGEFVEGVGFDFGNHYEGDQITVLFDHNVSYYENPYEEKFGTFESAYINASPVEVEEVIIEDTTYFAYTGTLQENWEIGADYNFG